MSPSRVQTLALDGSPDEVEAAFYEALRNADIDQLMACWADEDEIVCVHPGGPRVVGPVAIRATFESMFANGSIQAWHEQLRKVEALGCSMHNVLEKIAVPGPTGVQHAWVIATNVWLRTALGWRLAAHHASPGTTSEIQEVSDIPTVLH